MCFLAIWVIYAKARRSFVKQVTSGGVVLYGRSRRNGFGGFAGDKQGRRDARLRQGQADGSAMLSAMGFRKVPAFRKILAVGITCEDVGVVDAGRCHGRIFPARIFRGLPCHPSLAGRGGAPSWRVRVIWCAWRIPFQPAKLDPGKNRDRARFIHRRIWQPRLSAALDPAQLGFLKRRCSRASSATTPWRFGDLDLKVHHVLLAERHFSEVARVEFPHPRKALVIEPHRFLAPRHETLAPGLERLGVMQPQDFDCRIPGVRRVRSRGSLGKCGM